MSNYLWNRRVSLTNDCTRLDRARRLRRPTLPRARRGGVPRPAARQGRDVSRRLAGPRCVGGLWPPPEHHGQRAEGSGETFTVRIATTVFTGAAPRTIVRARTRVGVDATRALRRSSPSPANASPWTERAWPRGPTRPSPDAPPLRTRARRTLPEMPATIRRHRRRRFRGAASTQNARARAAAGAGASHDAPV